VGVERECGGSPSGWGGGDPHIFIERLTGGRILRLWGKREIHEGGRGGKQKGETQGKKKKKNPSRGLAKESVGKKKIGELGEGSLTFRGKTGRRGVRLQKKRG